MRFWERLYGAHPVWSGRVNPTLAAVAASWAPGRSLDLGCGEGGDVLWLAERGWDAAGIDLSPTAIARAREAAEGRGVAGEHGLGRARFAVGDLAEWAEGDAGEGEFDLVTASFLQSPVTLPRERILRAAARRVAPGGRLLVIAHAAPPPWAGGGHGPGDFPTPEGELSALGLDPARWEARAEVRERDAVGPDGATGRLSDTVVVARRIPLGAGPDPAARRLDG